MKSDSSICHFSSIKPFVWLVIWYYFSQNLFTGEMEDIPDRDPTSAVHILTHTRSHSEETCSPRLILRMYTQGNPTENQHQPQPRLLGNDLALNIPFSQNGEQERTGIGQRHSEGEFCRAK